jgi:hypothetical protein
MQFLSSMKSGAAEIGKARADLRAHDKRGKFSPRRLLDACRLVKLERKIGTRVADGNGGKKPKIALSSLYGKVAHVLMRNRSYSKAAEFFGKQAALCKNEGWADAEKIAFQGKASAHGSNAMEFMASAISHAKLGNIEIMCSSYEKATTEFALQAEALLGARSAIWAFEARKEQVKALDDFIAHLVSDAYNCTMVRLYAKDNRKQALIEIGKLGEIISINYEDSAKICTASGDFGGAIRMLGKKTDIDGQVVDAWQSAGYRGRAIEGIRSQIRSVGDIERLHYRLFDPDAGKLAAQEQDSLEMQHSKLLLRN